MIEFMHKHKASVQPNRRSSFCGSDDISMEIRYPNNNGWRRVEIERRASVDTIIMASFAEINFMTHFQSLGLFWFLLHFAFSLFQFAWSWSVRKVEEFSFERGKNHSHLMVVHCLSWRYYSSIETKEETRSWLLYLHWEISFCILFLS